MSVFMDLNLNYTADQSRLQSLIETAAHRESKNSRFTAEVWCLLDPVLIQLASELI